MYEPPHKIARLAAHFLASLRALAQRRPSGKPRP